MLLGELPHGFSQHVGQIVHLSVDLAQVQPQNDDLVTFDGVLQEADIHGHFELREENELEVVKLH
jgi:hypothetical protein